uniref:Uncharacterized protein n=1 Tax=Siphoviridae sp. ctr2f5 TaxID=2825684 RepID=A0A8S5QDN5_9CAUD|nr:MAG TPA: hypothetical protein [Siphoviridae sp. ctr2f5]
MTPLHFCWCINLFSSYRGVDFRFISYLKNVLYNLIFLI